MPDLHQRGPVIPSLYSDDMSAAESFYCGRLGFGRTGEWIEDGGMKWMELKHPTLETSPEGGAPLTLWFFANPLTGQDRPTLSGLIYFMIADVRAYAAELQGKAPFEWGPEEMPYGLLELGLKDNHGYHIVFAEERD